MSLGKRIIVAVGDGVVQSEAIHVAAATGMEILSCSSASEVADKIRDAECALLDTSFFAHLRAMYPGLTSGGAAGCCRVYVVTSNYEVTREDTSQIGMVYALPAQAPELLRTMGKPQWGGHAKGITLAITGASGGIGVSSFAVAVAKCATPTTLIDAVPDSGGLDLLMGMETHPGIRWQDIDLEQGSVDGEALREALPQHRSGTAVLTMQRTQLADPWRLTSRKVEGALAALGNCPGMSVVDMPRTGEIADAVLAAADAVVLVVPQQVRGVAAAVGLAARWSEHKKPLFVVARAVGYSGLTVEDLEQILNVKVTAQISTVPRLARRAETEGLGEKIPRKLAAAALKVLENIE